MSTPPSRQFEPRSDNGGRPTASAGQAASSLREPLAWVTAGIVAFVAVKLLVDILLLLLLESTLGAPGTALPRFAAEVVTSIAKLITLVYLGTAAMLCHFVHRASTNLRALRRTGMRFSPGWCVGWFFIPFANLVMPVQVMGEIWRASDPAKESDQWISSQPNSLLGVWWVTFVVASPFSRPEVFTHDRGTTVVVLTLGSCLYAVSGTVCVLLLRAITARQEALSLVIEKRRALMP